MSIFGVCLKSPALGREGDPVVPDKFISHECAEGYLSRGMQQYRWCCRHLCCSFDHDVALATQENIANFYVREHCLIAYGAFCVSHERAFSVL